MFYTLDTSKCYLHRNIYIDHSEHVFDNVKNLLRHAESLAIDSVTAKLSHGGAQWHEMLQKPTLGALRDVC